MAHNYIASWQTLCYYLLFVWNSVIGCEYVVALIDHTTFDNYKVIFIVTLSMGPSLTLKSLNLSVAQSDCNWVYFSQKQFDSLLNRKKK